MRFLLPMLAVLLLDACASAPKPVFLGARDRAELAKQRNVKAVFLSSPEVAVRMPAGQSGPVGPALPNAVAPGDMKGVLKDDPAVLVGREFLTHLKVRRAVASVPRDVAPAGPADGADRRSSTLDFRTLDWTLGPAPETPASFRVDYRAQGRLVRAHDGRVLWQALCQYPPPGDAGLRKSWDEVSMDGAAGFKTMMETAIRACGDQLITAFGQTAP